MTGDLLTELRAIADRYPEPRSGLLPMLHLIQSYDGCVSRPGLDACAEVLGMTTAEIESVATFYSMYKTTPVGQHLVGVCTNTLCAVLGGDAIYEHLRQHLGGTTSVDGHITLERIECNAACDYAPVVMVNWEFLDNQTPDSAVELTDCLRRGAPVAPARGGVITSWRDVERVLAGFDDGRADEGASAGDASLAGLVAARSEESTT